jgi:hypothetical protein
MEYDAEIIRTFAKQLYAQAGRIIFIYGLIVGLIGAGAGGAATGGSGTSMIIGLVLGILIGVVVGQARAFRLKLEAQVALAQVQIEENTRGRSN